VVDVPGVGIAAADPGEIGAGALRSPLERVVVHRLGGERIVPVALVLVAHRPDHLAVAGVAALAHVDVAPREFERAVGAHALDLLDGVLEVEERHDLHDTADGHDEEAEHEQQHDVALNLAVMLEHPAVVRQLVRDLLGEILHRGDVGILFRIADLGLVVFVGHFARSLIRQEPRGPGQLPPPRRRFSRGCRA
jgi:hypothetical protein